MASKKNDQPPDQRAEGTPLGRTAPAEANVRSAHARGAEMRFHGAAEMRGLDTPHSHFHDSGRFGRMFPLPPFQPDPDKLRQLGAAGGPMDAGATNPDSPVGLPAGFTFLGQFIDHDVTFDPTSSLERQVDPEAVANFRTPTLELDSVYGAGPGASPHLYQRGDGAKLLIGLDTGGGPNDLPRNQEGTALTGDPRNDENVIISQLHLAFLKFHNAVVDLVRADPPAGESVFERAQRLVRWHYQWIVLHEFLPAIVGQPVVDQVMTSPKRFYKWRNDPYIPVEFSVAAYRFGHSQIRNGYRLNGGTTLPIFTPGPSGPTRTDLRGGRQLASTEVIEFRRFFETGGPVSDLQKGKSIDTKLSSALLNLPMFSGTPGDPTSLATRNLLRGVTFGLPSGQAVAKRMGEAPLSPADLTAVASLGFDRETPLWYYILREAEVRVASASLGPVGGRIVAEVFIGLLEGDRMSYLRQDPSWTPTLATGGDFKMADLLRIAGVA